MEPGPTKRLTIAAGAVAAFFGFVALTSWTSSGEMDEQERRELGTFCFVLSQGGEYESRLTDGLLSGGQGAFGGGGAADDGFSGFIGDTLLDFAPERYQDDAAHLVEGLQRGLQGELTADETDAYIADFRRLERRASGDCEPFEGEVPDFGGLGGDSGDSGDSGIFGGG